MQTDDKPIVLIESLEEHESRLESLIGFLCINELARYHKFRSSKARDIFCLSHGLLRTTLGNLLGVDPKAIEFSYGPRGKPHIKTPETNLQFSLSHSGDYCALAIVVNKAIGIDIEQHREVKSILQLARRIASPVELAFVDSFITPDKPGLFFDFWTRKEAMVKATGSGISQGLSEITLASQETGFFQVVNLANASFLLETPACPRGYSCTFAVQSG